MSDEQSDEYLKLLKTTFDTATDIARAYIDTKIIQKDFNGNFVKFLEHNKHNFFTRWIPRKTCCCCPSSTISKQFEQFDNKIFTQIYQIDYTVSCKSLRTKNGLKKCVCQIVTKADVSLECLDIGALACIMKQYGKVDVIPLSNLNKIREVRNELCHTTNTDAFTVKELEDKWTTIETAMNCLLDEISPFLRKIFTKQIENIKKQKDKENLKDEIMQAFDRKFERFVASVNISALNENQQPSENKPKRLKVEADSANWDEDKVIANMNKSDQDHNTPGNQDSDQFHINSAEKQCVHFDLTAAPCVFSDKETLEKAIDNFIERLIKAGDIDVSKPGKLEINITVTSPLTKEEKQVVLSLFGQKETFAELGLTNEKNEQCFSKADHSKCPQEKNKTNQNLIEESRIPLNIINLKRESGLPLEMPKSSFKPKRSKRDTEDSPGKPDDDVVDVAYLHPSYPTFRFQTKYNTFTTEVVDLPAHLERFEEMPESQSGSNVCVSLAWDCPQHWKLSDIVDIMNKRLTELKGWFKPVLVYVDKLTGRVILQCFTQCQLFSSNQLFEHEMKNFIELVEDKCQLQAYQQGNKLDDVGIKLSVIMTPDDYLLDDDLKNLKSRKEKERVDSKETKLVNALVRLGIKQCLDNKNKEYNSKISSSTEESIKYKFYSYLRELARKRKNEISTKKLITKIKSLLPAVVAEFPELDLFDTNKYIYSCSNCSSKDVICWCDHCNRLYCCHCLSRHNFSRCLVFDNGNKSPAVTLIKNFDTGLKQVDRLHDIKVMNDKLIICLISNQLLKLLLWENNILGSKCLDFFDDYYIDYKISVIDSHTFALQTKDRIIIFKVKKSIINEYSRIPTDSPSFSFVHANGILYLLTYDIVKMTFEGNKVGEIKWKNIRALYANGTQIYYTTVVKGQFVNVIDTTSGDTIRSLTDFPTCPDQMDFTTNGNIVFLTGKHLWFTRDEGRCCYLLISHESGISPIPYELIRLFCLNKDEIYLVLKDVPMKISKYRLNEEMLEQSGSQPFTYSETTFQKSLPEPGFPTPVAPDVPVLVTSVPTVKTTTPAKHQTPEDPGPSNSLRNFPMELSSDMISMPVLYQPSLPQRKDVVHFYSKHELSQQRNLASLVGPYNLPPGDDEITGDEDLSDEDLSDESRD